MSRPGHRRLAATVVHLVVELLFSVRRGWLQFALAVLLAAGSALSSVALMAVAAWLLSRAAQHPPVLYLEAAAVLVRFFGISRGVLRYAERLVGHDVALRMQGALRLRVYDALSRTTLLGTRRGDLLLRMVADVEAVLDLVVRVALPLCSAVIVVAATTVAMSALSLGAGLVLLGSAVVGGLLVPWLAQRMSEDADAAAVPLRGQLGSKVHEIGHGAAELAAYGAAEPQLRELLDLDDRLRRTEQQASWVRGLAAASQVAAAGIAVVAALVIGSAAVSDGRLNPVMLAVLVLTPLAMHDVLATLPQAAQTLTRASVSLHRVIELLDAPPVGRGDLPADQCGHRARLHLDDVELGWPGGPVLHRGVTLSVQGGERVALVGPSGVGKTTLAATALGLIPPRDGRVESVGRVRYLAQDAHLFATSVAENVRIGAKDATDEQVVGALRAAGLDLPLDRMVGEGGATLSGGEARRLALARVLVGSAGHGHADDLLILDEPTEHLDAQTAQSLMADLWAATAGAATLVITHDPSVVRACDRVVTLRTEGA